MKPLIIGVDPGSTSAVAAIDLEGEIELLKSGKNFPPREIIQRIVKAGKPVVVASDKKETPSKVKKISSSIGAKLFEPEKDLSSRRKKELGKGTNSHEKDAVASAVHAKKQLHRDIRKIEKFNGEKDLKKVEIAERLFNDRPISEQEDTEEKTSSGKYSGKETEEENTDLEKKRLENRIENLEDYISSLKTELDSKNSRIENLEEKLREIKDEDRREIIEEREIKKREAIIRDKNREIEDLRDALTDAGVREAQYRKALQKARNGHVIVPIVDSVGEIEGEAVTRDYEILEKLEKQGVEIHHIEEVEGIELGQFMVVEELPDKTDFRSVIKEFKNDK
jgi:predicted RNase H-like nuclease (RuvC/YqgF family)